MKMTQTWITPERREEILKRATPVRELLTISDVAEIFDCCPGTVRNKIRQGYLPEPIDVLGNKRWIKSDFENWVRENIGDIL
jgi:predicted DNA-binding transcriptional regulator AlpA